MATVAAPGAAAGLASIDKSDVLNEIVEGQELEVPHMGAFEGFIASILARHMGVFVESHSLGLVVVEVLFRLIPDGSLQRRPDIAFVSFNRWPERIPPREESWNVVPNLAVEVISASNRMREVLEKVRDYFRAGVELVWVIDPATRVIYVHESLTRVHGLEWTEELDGGLALPGFRTKITNLFDSATKPE